MKTAAQVVEPIQSYMIGNSKPIMFMSMFDQQLGLVVVPNFEVKPGMQFHRIMGDAKQPYARVFTVLSVIWKKDVGNKYDKVYNGLENENKFLFNPGFKQSFYWMLKVDIQTAPLTSIIEIEV